MANLKPVRLHSIIGTATTWTDERWDEALTYLLGHTSTLDALAIVQTLYHDKAPNHFHKIDLLREFRNYPPTTLLGAFDLMRFGEQAAPSISGVTRAYSRPSWPDLLR